MYIPAGFVHRPGQAFRFSCLTPSDWPFTISPHQATAGYTGTHPPSHTDRQGHKSLIRKWGQSDLHVDAIIPTRSLCVFSECNHANDGFNCGDVIALGSVSGAEEGLRSASYRSFISISLTQPACT